MTRLLLSRGMSSQLQVSSSCSVPEIGVKSILSPKSMTCTIFMCHDQVPTRRMRSYERHTILVVESKSKIG